MVARQRRVNGKRGPARKPRAKAVTTALDSSATDYARLLADPINAPLVHPVYAGGDGGYLIRFDSTFTTTAGATDTSGYLHWTPGAMGPDGIELLIGAAANGSAPCTAITNGGGVNSPGYLFL